MTSQKGNNDWRFGRLIKYMIGSSD